MNEKVTSPAIADHGASRLPAVDVDSYNIELRDEDGFIGDKASKGALRDTLDSLRKALSTKGEVAD